jgi:uncharacterized protein YbjT (DUF2867 family)
MILVTGASGTVGSEVVKLLVAAGEKVRAMTRDPAKVKLDPKVEVVAGDFAKPESLDAAVAGADRVFSLSTGPELAAHDASLVRASAKAGARHLVKLSVLGAGGAAHNGITAWHNAGEQAIRESGLSWTFVRPCGFMSNALNWVGPVKALGKVFAPYADGKTAPVHPRDIAAVAAAALTAAGHEGKEYPLTGGEALSMAEQVKILSDAVGKPIQYIPVSDETAREGMLKAGTPEALVESLIALAAIVRSGGAAQVLPTVERVLGRKPLTFAEWAQENAAAFR